MANAIKNSHIFLYFPKIYPVRKHVILSLIKELTLLGFILLLPSKFDGARPTMATSILSNWPGPSF